MALFSSVSLVRTRSAWISVAVRGRVITFSLCRMEHWEQRRPEGRTIIAIYHKSPTKRCKSPTPPNQVVYMGVVMPPERMPALV